MIRNVLYKLQIGEYYIDEEGKRDRALTETLCQIINVVPGKIVIRPLYTNLLLAITNDHIVGEHQSYVNTNMDTTHTHAS